MLRIIFYLRFLIILICGLSYFGNDKAKDEPAKPIGDFFHDKMRTINENYDDDVVIGIFRKFGHFSAQSGEFVFNKCKNCNMLILAGHEEDECKEDRMDHETIKKLEEAVHEHYMFNICSTQFDRILCKDICKQT